MTLLLTNSRIKLIMRMTHLLGSLVNLETLVHSLVSATVFSTSANGALSFVLTSLFVFFLDDSTYHESDFLILVERGEVTSTCFVSFFFSTTTFFFFKGKFAFFSGKFAFFKGRGFLAM